MFSRRHVLRSCGAALSMAAASAATGCLGTRGESTSGVGDRFVDTSGTVTPSFLSVYTCEPVALAEGLGSHESLPSLGADFLANVENRVTGTALDDVERLTGQYGQVGGHTGGDLQFVRPSASHVVATGSIDPSGVAAWLTSLDAVDDLGTDGDYRRFGTGGNVPEAFVADESAVAYGNREGVGDADATAIAEATVEALDGDAAGVEAHAPEIPPVFESMDAETVGFATQFDLVAERPDVGADAYDQVAASLLAAGAGATVDGDEVRVERALRYRRDGAPPLDVVETALERAAEERDDRPLAGADWSVRRSDRTVVATATVDTALVAQNPLSLRSAFPIDALGDLTAPIDPRTLGRDAPPRVDWAPATTEDGSLEVVHASGEAVDDLLVRYEAGGETVEERWDGPVEESDRFVTDHAPDGGSIFDLVWAPDTADETILLRLELGTN